MNKAAGIIFLTADSKVLLLKRAEGGEWGLPAGSVEEGEEPLAAATREVSEETGYIVLADTGVIQVAVIDNPDGVQFTGYMQVLQSPFEVTLNDEHTDAQWFDSNALPEPLFMSTGDLIAKALTATAVAMDAADTARVQDGNGWWEVKRNPISKAGVYAYAGKNIPGADPTKVYMVFRPPEELGSKETIESFKLVPWINDHVMLGNGRPNTVAAEVKGVHGVIGQDVFFDGDTLYGNIKMWSAQHGATIAAGKTELSSGYRCRYEKAAGIYAGQHYDYVQREIRGNHLASVMDGRMGPEVSVMDSFSFTFDAKDAQIMADDKNPAPGGEGSGGEPTLADCVKMFKALEPLLPALSALAAAGATAPAKTDEVVVNGEDEADKAKAAGAAAAKAEERVATMDSAIKDMPQAVIKALAQRDKLAAELTPHVGVFDHSDMTPSQVVEYGITKLGIKCPTPGQESAFLSGYLMNKPKPGAAHHTPEATGMDASDTARPAFLDKYLAPKE